MKTRFTVLTLAWALICIQCKKPEVEVEEEGPPLPLPLSDKGSAPQPKEQKKEAEATPQDTIEMTVKQACRLFEAHLKYAGVAVGKYECHNIRKHGENIRIDSFMLMDKAGKNIEEAYNGCFWRKEQGEGFEVGYVDQVARRCQNREQYCKFGAVGAIPLLSFNACPGDREHLLLSKKQQLDKLVGRWMTEKGDSQAKIKADGRTTISLSGETHTGKLRLVDSVSAELLTSTHVIPLAYALNDDSLHLSRGTIAPASAVDPSSFVLVLSPKSMIRRFRGACYEIISPPRDYPVAIPCPLSEENKLISIQLKTREIAVKKVGNFWMDNESTRYEFKKVKAKKKSGLKPKKPRPRR